MKLQRWENEGGSELGQNNPGRNNTPGLLHAGQRFEVLSTHVNREGDQDYQIVEIKPLNTKETDPS